MARDPAVAGKRTRKTAERSDRSTDVRVSTFLSAAWRSLVSVRRICPLFPPGQRQAVARRAVHCKCNEGAMARAAARLITRPTGALALKIQGGYRDERSRVPDLSPVVVFPHRPTPLNRVFAPAVRTPNVHARSRCVKSVVAPRATLFIWNNRASRSFAGREAGLSHVEQRCGVSQAGGRMHEQSTRDQRRGRRTPIPRASERLAETCPAA
jgi:hypothetical protein